MTNEQSPPSMLTEKQRYAAGALFSTALNHVQIHHTPLGSTIRSHDSNKARIWTDPSSGLIRPVLKFLQIESEAWGKLEAAAACSPEKQNIADYLRMLVGETDVNADKEVDLANAIDAISAKMEKAPADHESVKEKKSKYEHAYQEKFPTPETNPESKPVETDVPNDNTLEETKVASAVVEKAHRQFVFESNGKRMDEAKILSYPRKMVVLYELLSACLANIPEDNQESKQRRKGYDARHRVTLRLIATWFDIKWTKMEAIETMIACSAMALKEEKAKEENQSSGNTWAEWKRGSIIGAAALTGGTLMAITGGLAAPAIAASFSALAPTLGAVVPVIGASGFAAVASAAGSSAGSVAVAASFGAAGAGLTGSKMARRIGDVDEFEFKVIGENHNQGRLSVEISISGFVCDEEDFVRPWEGIHDNVERYVLQWESKHLIALSSAIKDWLTSKVAKEVMKKGATMVGLGAFMTAVAWPTAILSLTSYIDSIWTIAIDRCDKAGKMLADVLRSGLQGHRPVTLVGFSLGARLIFKCLEDLAESGTDAGIVERVVLLGAPIPVNDENWEATRKVVGGRYVNAYSTNDWMLGVAFRASLLTTGLAGIQAVDVSGIENVDVSEIVQGHSSYLWGSQLILEQLELDTYYPVFKSNHDKVVTSSDNFRCI